MRLTKLVHSCVRLEKDGATLVIDPGPLGGAGSAAAARTRCLLRTSTGITLTWMRSRPLWLPTLA
jgi:L-ascorbate metabolism protein UlaG (beta-lactamase superfamily)